MQSKVEIGCVYKYVHDKEAVPISICPGSAMTIMEDFGSDPNGQHAYLALVPVIIFESEIGSLVYDKATKEEEHV